jgi:hypothetical protein
MVCSCVSLAIEFLQPAMVLLCIINNMLHLMLETAISIA